MSSGATAATPLGISLAGYCSITVERLVSRDRPFAPLQKFNDPATPTDLHFPRRIDALHWTNACTIASVSTASLEWTRWPDRRARRLRRSAGALAGRSARLLLQQGWQRLTHLRGRDTDVARASALRALSPHGRGGSSRFVDAQVGRSSESAMRGCNTAS
ncbi:MAG: hypothetical protein JO090_12945 [Rhizobacter sp.]|nr:hypothetical protein [Rhizobacter sp.]